MPSTSDSHAVSPAIIPPAFFMCTEPECKERQSTGEISMFESKWPPPPPTSNNHQAANGDLKSPPRGIHSAKQQRRIVDPHYAMTKYRRSAAGLDVATRAPARSIEQLECCLSQLEYILSSQRKPTPTTTTASTDNEFPPQSLCGTVSFVEDRIRAIQKDMVVSQRPSAAVQYRIVKLHVVILYLLSGVATYESKFGQQALSAALTNYWEEEHLQHTANNNNSLQKDRESHERDDDILCFMALQQLCQYYNHASNNSNMVDSSLPFILDYYRRNVQLRRQSLADFPKFQWALHLVHLAVMGRPRSILWQLAELGGALANPCSTSAFAVLCRCCMAPVIDILRFQALDQYNKAYMKGEKVHIEELARLLYFVKANEAGDFCVEMAGLTRHADDEHKIVFKVGPVSWKSDTKMGARRQDEFVFGELYSSGSWGSSVHLKSTAITAWDHDDDAPDNGARTNGDLITAYNGARMDAEGVFVPPPELLHRILR